MTVLAGLDGVIYFGKPVNLAILWYHAMNFAPALFLWRLSHLKHTKITTCPGALLIILVVSLVPILVNTMIAPLLPLAPLINTEGLILRLMPILLIGLILIAWRYNVVVIILLLISFSSHICKNLATLYPPERLQLAVIVSN